MNDSLPVTIISTMPTEYSAAAVDDAFQQITFLLSQMMTAGRIRTNKINVTDLPTSAVGLAAGDVWWDLGTATLRVVAPIP